MRALWHRYLQLLKAVLVAVAALLVALVFVNFVLRYAFASGIAVSEELARFALVWSVFVGATVALAEGRHMSVLELVNMVPARLARLALFVAQLACLGASLFFLVGAWRQASLNMSMTGAITGWPLGVAIYGGGVFFAAHAIPLILLQMATLWRGAGRPTWQEG